ncbi:MAG: PIN domain-containing protein, partial [archaeon]|nr:PIN domain-containing protein [archaeon]
KKARIVITDLLIKELSSYYSVEKMNGMVKLFEKLIDGIIVKEDEYKEASEISKNRNIPLGDVIHAIIARNHNLILIARDKHFLKLKDISPSLKPEEI